MPRGRPSLECAHGTIHDFKRDGLWTCSHCGKRAVWSGSWSYHGSMECRVCWMAQIDYVACSEACRVALTEARTVEAAVVKARKQEAEVAEIDRQIAELSNRRRAITKQISD